MYNRSNPNPFDSIQALRRARHASEARVSPVTGALDVVAVGFGDAGWDEVCALEPLAVLRDLTHKKRRSVGSVGVEGDRGTYIR